MSRLPTPHLQTTPDYRLYLFPLALIGIVPLFPPETRGESRAGVAVLDEQPADWELAEWRSQRTEDGERL